MSWAKLCDGFYSSPDILAVGNAAAGVFARSLSYSGQHETDGRVPEDIAKWLCAGDDLLREKLIARGLWAVHSEGISIPNYLKYNPSKKRLNRERKEAAKRQAAWRKRNASTNGEVTSTASGKRRVGSGRVGKEEGSTTDAQKKRGGAGGWRRVPAGEVLTSERRGMGIAVGLAPSQIEPEWGKFTDYEFRRTRSDVDAAWRNWCRKAGERQQNMATLRGFTGGFGARA